MLENNLIDKCKAGDGEAFRRLMANYNAKLFGYLCRFSDSQDTTDDMFQETLIKVWKGISKYDEQKKFSSWLFTVAHNVAIDALRIKKSNNNFVDLDEVNNQIHVSGPDEIIIKEELILRINNSVENLSEKQKMVFLLRQHGEMSFKEIAKTTNEPINTVLSHMRYAVKKIKKQLDGKNETRQKSVI